MFYFEVNIFKYYLLHFFKADETELASAKNKSTVNWTMFLDAIEMCFQSLGESDSNYIN